MTISADTIERTEAEGLTYYNEIYQACLRKLDFNEDTAYTCVQNTYLALEETLKANGHRINNCRNWLFALSRINIKKYYKEKAQRANKLVEQNNYYGCNEESQQEPLSSVCSEFDLEAEVELTEQNTLLLMKMALLEEDEQKLMIEIYYKRKKIVDIAAAEHKTAKAVSKQHQRVISKLRKIIGDDVMQMYKGEGAAV